MRYLAAIGAKAVKVWYIVRPPDLTVEKSAPFVAAAGDEARKAGLPLIVHATGLAEAKAALRGGANVLVHSVEDLPLDPEFLEPGEEESDGGHPDADRARRLRPHVPGRHRAEAPAVDDPNHCVDDATLAKVAETASVDPSLVAGDRAAARDARGAIHQGHARQPEDARGERHPDRHRDRCGESPDPSRSRDLRARCRPCKRRA